MVEYELRASQIFEDNRRNAATVSQTMVSEVVVAAASHLQSLDVISGLPDPLPEETHSSEVLYDMPAPTQDVLFSPRGAQPEEYGRATSQDLDPGSYAYAGSDDERYDHPGHDDSVGYQEGDWVMPGLPSQAPRADSDGEPPQPHSPWQPDEQPVEPEDPGTAAAEEALMAEVAGMDPNIEA